MLKVLRFHVIFTTFSETNKKARKTAGAENPVLLGNTDTESATSFTASLNSSSRSIPHDGMIVMSHASLSITEESGRRPSAKRLGYAQRLAQGTRKDGREEAPASSVQ